MGFSNTNAQLMTVPPYVAGAISTLFFPNLSDRYYWRMPFIAIPMGLIAIGYSILISFKGDLSGHVGQSMFAVILTCMGIYALMPTGTSWVANNLAPASRRAVGVAWVICVGNVGGIVGSFMYLDSEKPKYFTGFGLSIAFGATGLLMSLVLELSYVWANRKKAKISEFEVRATYSEDQLLLMGDQSPLFRYTT